MTGDAVESVLADIADRPVPSSKHGQALLDLVRVMARLRGPGGCPWDHEQTHRSLARHLLEETHEALDAIDTDDLELLREELGDVLFATVALARKLGVDAESALRRTTRGFAERYERFNELLRERGQSLDELSEAEIRSLFRQARA